MNNDATNLYNAAAASTQHRISELGKTAGLTWERAKEAAKWWMSNAEDVAVEPESHGRRITQEEREAPLMIGGEARHFITFN